MHALTCMDDICDENQKTDVCLIKIHQAGAYLNRQSSLAWETSTRIRGLEPYLRTDGYNVDIVDFKIDETYRQVREIAKRSPLVKKNSLFSIDDVAQEVLCILMPHLDK